MSRREARDLAFKAIYQNEFQKDNIDNILNTTLEENQMDDESKKYILNVINGIKENESLIEEKISNNLKQGWEISRISKLNIAILKIAIFELIYMKEEIPDKVAISEALYLMDLYGDKNDKPFVNGILAKIMQDNS